MSDFGGPSDRDLPGGYSNHPGYALSGRIMLSAIIVLFFVVVLMLLLHLYARWYLLRSRRRRRRFLRRNRNNRSTNLVFYVDGSPAASHGLDSSVLNSLPVFSYSQEGRCEPLECAVCLSEFEESEKARLLPKCGHSFHIECIDMWFHSHSTCPLCRSPVEAVESPESQSAPAASVSDNDNDPGSGLCAECQSDGSVTSGAGPSTTATSSSGSRRKPRELVGVSVEVPRRTEFEDESGCESPASQYRSPLSRMLSFRRILSRERRGNTSPSAASEPDLELGKQESGPAR